MTTPPQPPNTQPPSAQDANYRPGPLGGGFEMPTPVPPVTPYLLSPDAFLTLRDGEMSEVRSLRDISIGAFVAGVTAIVSQLSTLDWNTALKEGRHPILCTVILSTITATALLAWVITHMLMIHVRTRSAYSRQTKTIEEYFGIEGIRRGFLSRLLSIFTRSSR